MTSSEEAERVATAIEQALERLGGVQAMPDPPPGYAHLPMATIDSIFSLRAHYSTTRSVVASYAEAVADRLDRPVESIDAGLVRSGDVKPHPIDEFLRLTNNWNGYKLADALFGGNRQKAPGTSRLKADVTIDAAHALAAVGIDTPDDLNEQRLTDAKRSWLAVKGLGTASWQYFLSLSGGQEIKPDVMIRRFVTRMIDADHLVSDVTASSLVRKAAAALVERHPEIAERFGLRALDHFVWQLQSGRLDGAS